MTVAQSQLYCRQCKRGSLHARERFSTAWAILLLILTGGTFIVFLPVIAIADAGRYWRCQTCGREQRSAGAVFARSIAALLGLAIVAGLAWGAWYVYHDDAMMREVRELIERP